MVCALFLFRVRLFSTASTFNGCGDGPNLRRISYLFAILGPVGRVREDSSPPAKGWLDSLLPTRWPQNTNRHSAVCIRYSDITAAREGKSTNNDINKHDRSPDTWAETKMEKKTYQIKESPFLSSVATANGCYQKGATCGEPTGVPTK